MAGRDGLTRAERVRIRLAKRYGGGVVKNDEMVRRIALGAPVAIDPGDALIEEVHRSRGHVEFLLRKCQDMEESLLVYSQVMETREEQVGLSDNAVSYQKVMRQSQSEISRWWEMYTNERRHLRDTAVAALKAGVDERRVRLQERSYQALEAVIEGIVTGLGHSPADPEVHALIGQELAQLVSKTQEGTYTAPQEGRAQAERMHVQAHRHEAHRHTASQAQEDVIEAEVVEPVEF